MRCLESPLLTRLGVTRQKSQSSDSGYVGPARVDRIKVLQLAAERVKQTEQEDNCLAETRVVKRVQVERGGR